MGAMIGNFGVHEGIATFRICGEKEALYKIIEECRASNEKFEDTPIINKVHNGQWTMLLKLKVYVKAR